MLSTELFCDAVTGGLDGTYGTSLLEPCFMPMFLGGVDRVWAVWGIMGPTSNLVVNGIVEQIPPLSIYPSWNSWKPKIKGLKRLFSRTPAKKFGVTTQVSCVNLAGLENPQWEQKILEAFRSCACWKLCHCPVTVHPQPPHIKYPLWVAAPKFIVPVPNQGCLWLLGILIYVCVIILISIKRVIRNNKKKNDIHISIM